MSTKPMNENPENANPEAESQEPDGLSSALSAKPQATQAMNTTGGTGSIKVNG